MATLIVSVAIASPSKTSPAIVTFPPARRARSRKPAALSNETHMPVPTSRRRLSGEHFQGVGKIIVQSSNRDEAFESMTTRLQRAASAALIRTSRSALREVAMA